VKTAAVCAIQDQHGLPHFPLTEDNLFVMKENGEVVAYTIWQIIPPEAELLSVATHRDFLRRGCAETVLTNSIKKLQAKGCTDFYLEVRAGNTPALALYQKLGFVEYNRRKGYYSDGEDAVLMRFFKFSS
jgi:ribosomal-protein-alanine N-acetyltransferase